MGIHAGSRVNNAQRHPIPAPIVQDKAIVTTLFAFKSIRYGENAANVPTKAVNAMRSDSKIWPSLSLCGKKIIYGTSTRHTHVIMQPFFFKKRW